MRAWVRLAALALLLFAAGAAQAQTQPCAQTIAPKLVSASSYTVNTTDRCGWILLTAEGAVTVSLPATGLIFAPNFQFTVLPINGATITFNNLPDPSTGQTRTVNLQSMITMASAQGAVVIVQQDMNWYALPTGRTEGSGSVTSLTATPPIVITPDPTTTTGDISHADSGVVPGSYTSANITVDEFGHVTTAANGPGGTVTSVGLSSPGGIFGITGTNPITSSGTFGYTTSGSSGGIPYFSSTSQLSSSGVLTIHSVVIGGGGGGAPSSVGGCIGGVLAWDSGSVDPQCTADPVLGASGTHGSITFGNSTSGLLTLETVTGALGTVTAKLQAADQTLAALDVANQTVTGGFIVSSNNIGTIASGTLTVACGTRDLQYFTNNGAFTLAADSNDGSCAYLMTNGASAGAITLSGFTLVAGACDGAALDTTSGNKFKFYFTRINGVSDCAIKAYQ